MKIAGSDGNYSVLRWQWWSSLNYQSIHVVIFDSNHSSLLLIMNDSSNINKVSQEATREIQPLGVALVIK